MGTVRIDSFRAITAQASARAYAESMAEHAERIADAAEDVRRKATRHAKATRKVQR